MNPKLLPPSFVKLIAPADRARLGIKTTDEAQAAAIVKSERKLQNLIDSYLRQQGIEPIRSRMDKRSTINLGAPDFLLAYHGQPIALEVKLPGGKLSKEQESMRAIMTTPTNGWHWFTVYSLDDVRDALALMAPNI